VASTERGVCKISVPRESRKDFFEWLKEHCDVENVIDNRARNKEVIDQLTRYFNGKLAKFTCSVDLIGTPFQIRIWKELSKIPYGTTITYGQLAAQLGVPRDRIQALGAAIGANPLAIIRPCHRVVGSDGAMRGYAGGVERKQQLLAHEGALLGTSW